MEEETEGAGYVPQRNSRDYERSFEYENETEGKCREAFCFLCEKAEISCSIWAWRKLFDIVALLSKKVDFFAQQF